MNHDTMLAAAICDAGNEKNQEIAVLTSRIKIEISIEI